MKKEIHIIILTLLFSIALGGWNAMAQSGAKVHVVQKNETLYRIGLKYKVTVSELYRLNPNAREGIRVGQKLILPDYVSTSKDSRSPNGGSTVYHAVQKGETLYSIARRYDVSVNEIMAANPSIKSPDNLPLGIVLKIPTSGDHVAGEGNRFKPITPPVQPSPSAKELKVISVPAGATVYSILKSTNWSESDFYRHNPQVRDGLIAGSKILVPDLYGSTEMKPDDGFVPVGRIITAVLALPFRTDTGRRFADYYEGFLLMLKDAKEKGINVDLYVYDCSEVMIANTLSEIRKLPHVDLLIGGVTIQAMNDLATVAHQKGAMYVVPFTSKKLTASNLDGLQIYQINTPHESLYDVAAEKFVEHYSDRHVHIVRYENDSSSKEAFINELKNKLRRAGKSFSESSNTEFAEPGRVESLVSQYGKIVVVPNSGSQLAANNTMAPIVNVAESLGSDMVTAFGYPEWQTYTHSVGKVMKKINATFYTTFFVNVYDSSYQLFQKEFISWFGHGTGVTFPKYSILGYDTGAFFLMPSKGDPVGHDANFLGGRQHQGVQSNFYFRSAPDNVDMHSNHGVFFVRYLSNGRVERF